MNDRKLMYWRWIAMRHRCYTARHPYYERYGGRGITVCDRWLISFENFLADIGPPPFARAQLDRIDNDQGYYPGNVRWTTAKENSMNRDNITTFQENKSTTDIAKELGMAPSSIRYRIKKCGLTLEQAASVPRVPNGKRRYAFAHIAP